MPVSIHAPVWGATIDDIYLSESNEFQSTHPCGVRLLCCGFQYRLDGFNPRTRVGCDATAHAIAEFLIVSIHAPVWGATYSTN